jgi:hypothetical protein
MNKIKQSDPDFYFEHIYENKNRNHDTAKTRSVFKPKEVEELKKSHDSWQDIRLKAWSEKYRENKKHSSDEFEYLL